MGIKKAKLDKSRLMELYYNQGLTLQDIGDANNITRERVRQLMARHDLPRMRRKQRHPPPPKYTTLEDYFADYTQRSKDTPALTRLLDYSACAECGGQKFLEMHHIRYPASSKNDIQILCRSCHRIKHNKNMTYERQLLLFLNYQNGVTRKELMVQFDISKALVHKIIHKIRNGYRTLRG